MECPSDKAKKTQSKREKSCEHYEKSISEIFEFTHTENRSFTSDTCYAYVK